MLIPFAVTFVIIRWLFLKMAGFLSPIVKNFVPRLPLIEDSVPDFAVSILSIILLIVIVYIVGAVTQFVIGKRIIAVGEMLLLRIPIVRTIYTATQQVMKSMSLPDRTAFKSVVLVEFPRPGLKAIGFLTGYIADASGKQYCKVFIPTTPNPTTGFFELVPREEVVETTMTIEDAFKAIISGGIVSPDIFGSVSLDRNPTYASTSGTRESAAR